MKHTKVLFFLSYFVLTNAIDYKLTEGVLELDNENFNTAIAENKFLFVEFYAPWCSYCEQVRPEFIEVAKHLTTENVSIRLGAVNVDKYHDIGDLYQIEWLPEFRLFANGEIVNYTGSFETSSHFVQWLKPYHTEL